MAEIEKVNKLQITPIRRADDIQYALRDIQTKLNELIRVVNQLVDKANGV